MIDKLDFSDNNSENINSLLTVVNQNLERKCDVLKSKVDYLDFMAKEHIHLISENFGGYKVYVTKGVLSRLKDFKEIEFYFSVVGKQEDIATLGYLLIIEEDKYKEIFSVFKKKKERMDRKQTETEDILFRASKPKFSLEEIILSEVEKEDIKSALTLMRERDLIYDSWGFSEIDSKPRLILNFYGAPGTGKTMSAHAVAHELKKQILLINYSEIESKYVGDAPKNLMKAFEEATRTDAVLFFDEADSFLGKRVENVTSSSDQSVNSLRSQMLILLEDFEGVVIFATNLVKNYDSAFESRILKHLEFKLPSQENRVKILNRMLVNKIPYSPEFEREIVLSKLADITEGFSGRELKNAVLETLSLAVHNGRKSLDESIFVEGFEKSKRRKDAVESNKTTKVLPKEIKERLEDKIKKQLAESV